MKITNIRTMRLWGPREHGCGGVKTKSAKILVRVDTDVGLYGLGEVEDFMGVAEGIAYLKNYLAGRDPMAICPLVSEGIYGSLPPHHAEAKRGVMAEGMIACPIMSPTATPTGPIVWALSGVEIALCDLVGKALKTPVYNLLGGKFRDKVKIYLDRSSPADFENPDAWRKMASAVAKEGFTQMKFDIDYTAPELTPDVWNRSLSLAQINRIVKRIEIARKAVGPDFEICVDCHMHYGVPDALRLAEALAHLNLLWLEDPTPITNPDALRFIRAKSPIAICTGELFTPEQFRLVIDHEGCDILHPDVLFCGGLHEAHTIAKYGELHYLPMAMHCNGGALAAIASAHVAAACKNFLGLEYHFIETPWIGEYVTRDVPLFQDGHLRLTDAPGLGVELNIEICKKYLAPGQSLFESPARLGKTRHARKR